MSTPTVEDYLVAIYTLENEDQEVIGARLAEILGVKASTVTATIRRMQRDGLIELRQGKRISPTEKGRLQVQSLIRRHRLVERWLTDILGISWHRCHLDAHRLEHAMSDEIIDRLSQTLGNPATCPHGNPIPGNPAEAEVGKPLLLSEAPPDQALRIQRLSELSEDMPAFLQYLFDHGLEPGASLRVKEVEPFSGLLIVDLGGREVTVSQKIASKIWVRRWNGQGHKS